MQYVFVKLTQLYSLIFTEKDSPRSSISIPSTTSPFSVTALLPATRKTFLISFLTGFSSTLIYSSSLNCFKLVTSVLSSYDHLGCCFLNCRLPFGSLRDLN